MMRRHCRLPEAGGILRNGLCCSTTEHSGSTSQIEELNGQVPRTADGRATYLALQAGRLRVADAVEALGV
jgi:hypothetical protein